MDQKEPATAPARDSGHRRHAGFSVIELLVTIAVITVLLALILPAVSSARHAGDRIKCMSNLKELLAAASHYCADDGAYPIGFQIYYKSPDTSLSLALRPYYQDESLLQCPEEPEAIDQVLEAYWFTGSRPAPTPPPYRSYQANTWVFRNTVSDPSERRVTPPCKEDRIADMSNLIGFYDGTVLPTRWSSSIPLEDGRKLHAYGWEILQARHVGVTWNAAFLDGHVSGLPAELADSRDPNLPWDPVAEHLSRPQPIPIYQVRDGERGRMPIFHAGADPYPRTPNVYHLGQYYYAETRPGFGAAVFGPAE